MQTLRTLSRLITSSRSVSWADWGLWIQAYCLLGIMRLGINLLPFRRFARFLGRQQMETGQDVRSADLATAKRIKWAIESTSRFTPWESNCFPQASAAQWLLRRRNIASTLYLGASFNKTVTPSPSQQRLVAHAWLRCGHYFVTGGKIRHQYTVITTFASKIVTPRE